MPQHPLLPESRKRKLTDVLVPSGSSIPPPMTVKEFEKQVMDSQQQPSRHRQRDNRKKQILSPNLTTDGAGRTKLPTKTGTFWAWFSAHQARSFRYPKRQFGKSKLVFRIFQVAWFDSWWCVHYVEDGDKAICHTCTRVHLPNTPAGHVNVPCNLHHQMLYKLEGCHAKEGRFFAT